MEGRDKNKSNSAALMESLRKNPPQVRSINELVKLLHVISAEQRSCNILRSCVDKVLMNMSNICTLRDYIERLRSVSRTNGFRFELPASSGPETRCCLVSDMFSVKILLGTSSSHDHSPTVLDVRIQHHRDDFRSCPHLVNIIRAGNFLELSDHLKGLTEMYLTSGNRQMRTRVFMALQSLETDLIKMSHVYRETHKDTTNLDTVMKGTVGLLTPRVAGDRSHLTYYVSPYDLIDTTAKHEVSIGEIVPKHVGLHAEVGIEQSASACNLPISPLISNKHPINNTGVPRFMDVSHHNSTMVQAYFVLYLKPAVPVLSRVADKIRQVTNLPLESDGKTALSYLEMLHADKNTFRIAMGEQKSDTGGLITTTHVYHLNISELKGTMVSKVFFTHPGHVTQILEQLRKQAYLNTLISSCIRSNNKSDKSREEQWYFEVSCSDNIDKINITLEHPQPSCKGTAFLEVQLHKDGTCGCKIYTGRGDPPLCSDQFVAKVLQKCSSIPITMKKLMDQSIKHPRKESDLNRVRPPALFGAASHPIPTRTPNILTPVQRPVLPQRRLSVSSATGGSFTGTLSPSLPYPPAIMEQKNEIGKKVVRNPMLAKLLIPNSISTNQSESSVQPKNHPMLMGLLKDEDNAQEILSLPPLVPPNGKNPLFPNSQHPNMVGTMQHSQYNSGSMMGLISPNSTFPNMDPQIPIPVSHQMPPPSYPTHHQLQSQYSNPSSLPTLSPAQHSPAGAQFQIAHSPRSSMEDMTGPVTPTYPMMSPNLMSSNMPPVPPIRGRRGSRTKSRSIESQQSMGSMDYFDLPTPATFEPQMSVDSDASISELLGIQTRPGMTPLRRTDSMSPGAHMPLQHTTSLKSLSETTGNNSLVRSISVGTAKSPRSLASSSPRNLKTPTLATPDGSMVGLGSPTSLFDGSIGQLQRGSRVRSYEGHLDMGAMGGRGDFFRLPLSSTSPAALTPLSSIPGSATDSEADPFTFTDECKNPTKISMPESTVGALASRGSKPSVFTSSQSTMSNTGASDTLRELAKSKPVLLRALTGTDSPIPKSETVNLQRLMSTSGVMPIYSSMATTLSGMTSATSFDLPKFITSTATMGSTSDKGLVRQNAVDKQGGPQGKSGEGKTDKPVKRRNSNKGEDGKPPAKKRGRPPAVKDHGGKRKKAEIAPLPSTQLEDTSAAGNKSIMLNIKLSATGAPISSVTKTKPIPGPSQSDKNSTSNNSPATTGPSMTGASGNTASNNYGGEIARYLKDQEEQMKRKMKKVSGKSTSSGKQSFTGQSSSTSAGNSANPDKPQAAPVNTKQPSSTGPAQKRPRKNSIKDVLEKLCAKQAAEKDANSNLLTKAKPVQNSPSYQKISASVTSFKGILKSATEDKAMAKAVATKPTGHTKSIPGKAGVDLAMTGKSASLSSAGQGRDYSQNLQHSIRKDSAAKAGRLQQQAAGQGGGKQTESMNLVLQKVMEAAAATTTRGSPAGVHTPANKLPAKPTRPPPVKARSVTPTPAVVANTVQRKSPSSQMLKTGDASPAFRQLATKSATSSGTPPPVKKSPSRTAGSFGGLPSRPNSASPIEPLVSAGLRPLSSSPTALLRKSSDQQFIAPSISPTPKRTTSPLITRTTPPLTRFDDKTLKSNPHKPSPTGSRIATPVQMSPQSPDGRLIIDDGNMPAPSVSAITAAQASRDEQMPSFLPQSRSSDRQSPERAVTESPMSPPSTAPKGLNLTQGIRRSSTPRSTNVSPALQSIPSVGVTDSPCHIDDDLMDVAVT